MRAIVELTNIGGRFILPPPLSVLATIKYQCSYEVKGAENDPRYKAGKWDGRKKLYASRYDRFPIGLWSRIRTILEQNSVHIDIIDNCKRPTPRLDIDITASMEKREYQEEAVRAAIDSGQSILQIATGGGKTAIAADLISQLKVPTLFLVHTKDLLYQAKSAFEDFLTGGDATIGQIGDGIIDIQPITVATMQTVSKCLGVSYEEYEFDDSVYKDGTKVDADTAKIVKKAIDGVDLVIWDEVHRVACDTAYGISQALKKVYYRVGLSASPWRDDGADIMIEAAMGNISYVMSASDLIDLGYLVTPIIRRVKVPSRIPWFSDGRVYDTIYKEEIVENDTRNALIVKYAAQFMEQGMPVLILVQRINHGNKLKKLISEQYNPIEFISGKDYTDKRLNAIQGMRDGTVPALIASTIADEGLDIKRLTAIILAGGGKSSTRALQRIGRVLRPFEGKTHAVVVDFDDEAKYLRDHTLRRKNIYKSERHFTILEV